MGLTKEKHITLNTTVWEDNQGCLILDNLEPPRMTPRSKYYVIKYHWFRTQLKPNGIVLKSIASSSQLVDMFTNGLRRILFEANLKQWDGNLRQIYIYIFIFSFINYPT